MTSHFALTLPRSPQGAGYFTPMKVQGHVFKFNEGITEEDMEDDGDKTYSFVDYKVQDHDTLEGIALSHNISPNILKIDNGFSSDIVYTGQTIKIRTRNKSDGHLSRRSSAEQTDGAGQDPSYLGKGDFLARLEKETEGLKLEHLMVNELQVFYCTSVGDVEGTIRISDSLIRFVPNGLKEKSPLGAKKNPEQPESEDKLADFITCIDVRDIDECSIVAIPNPQCDEIYEVTKEFAKDFLLQIILKNHGQRSMGKYFESLMANLRQQNVPYSCVYFKVHGKQESQREFTNKMKNKMALDLQNSILAAKNSVQASKDGPSLSKIPYVEFLYEKFDHRDGELLRRAVKKATLNDIKAFQEHKVQNKSHGSGGFFSRKIASVFKKMTGTLKLVDDSQILTKEQFGELIRCIPQIYQTIEWQLIYSNKVHGTSFANMMRKTMGMSPLILVIKDEHGFSFGAFLTHKLKISKTYYGGGETFLFTFRDLDDISTFTWSKKNSMFMNVNENGIMIGAGPQCGLWINNELTKGRSYKCDTFDNPPLSLESEFQIIKIEIWTIIDSVQSFRMVKQHSLI